jgi:hypothetical protein
LFSQENLVKYRWLTARKTIEINAIYIILSKLISPLTVLVSRQGRFKSIENDAKKAAIAGSTFSRRGFCGVARLSIGTQLKMVVGPEQALSEFLVTQASHCLQSGDYYQVHFKVVSGDINLIPTPILQAPQAQLAVVRKNDYVSGEDRVPVQFQWQEGDNRSD